VDVDGLCSPSAPNVHVHGASTTTTRIARGGSQGARTSGVLDQTSTRKSGLITIGSDELTTATCLGTVSLRRFCDSRLRFGKTKRTSAEMLRCSSDHRGSKGDLLGGFQNP